MNHIYYCYGDESRSHEFLFYILNRYYNVSATEGDLKKSPYGKFYLEENPVHFNLSHSKDVLALAVGNKPVGIDVEKIREKQFSRVANVYFGNTAESPEEFFRLWTKAEAFVKYRAGTVAADLKKIKIDGDDLFYEGEKVTLSVETMKIKDFILSVVGEEATADIVEVAEFI